MRPSRVYPLLSLLLLVAAFCWYRQGGVVFSQSAGSALTADGVVSLRVRMGVTDTEPRVWDGSVTVSNGELAGLRDWHPRDGNAVSGSTWKFASSRGPIFVRRPWEEEQLNPTRPYVNTPGVIIDVKTSPGTKVAVETRNGNFEIDPRAPGVISERGGGSGPRPHGAEALGNGIRERLPHPARRRERRSVDGLGGVPGERQRCARPPFRRARVGRGAEGDAARRPMSSW